LTKLVLKTRANSSASQYVASSQRSSPQAISHGFPSVHPLIAPVSLLPNGALPKLFPTISLPSTLPSLPCRSFPSELSPSYFPRFPFRPPFRCSRIAPSHRSSPQAISHGFPSVHPVVIPVSLLPTGALPKLFPTVSLPSTLSSFPYRSFALELPPSYFPRLPFRPPCHHSRYRSFPPELKLFPTPSLPSTLSTLPYRSFPLFPFRPPSRHSRIAPSDRSSPEAISHGLLSVHPVVTSVSPLPTGALPKLPMARYPPSVHPVVTPVPLLPTRAPPKLFHIVSLPSTLSSLPYRAPFHRSSPQAISHGFPSVHPVVIPVYRSFPPELSPSYFPRFPFRPPCRHSRIVPSHWISLKAISHSAPSVHPVLTLAWLLPTGALLKLFPTVYIPLPSTLSSFPYRSFPPELSPSYFPRFPFRPPCRHSRIIPSHWSSPKAISHSAPSVHPVVIPVSLLPTRALPKLFPTVSVVESCQPQIPTDFNPLAPWPKTSRE